MHEAVDDQSRIETFHGYMPEHGAMFLREAIAKYYSSWNVDMTTDEVFVSSGACDDLGDLLEMFDRDNTVLVIEPAYPEYVDTNLLYGRKVIHLPAGEGDGFLPLPDESIDADIIYICSPNNPTGSAYTREKLKKWVDYANEKDAVILYDAAYEIFIEEDDVPHSIYEIEGADTCAVEVCSFSKTAGFTGTRVGYTIVPSKLERMGVNLNALWSRNRETRTNGISYILQKGASAVFTPEGQKQIYESISVYKKNAKVIMDALDKCGFWYVGGKNSPYVWMKCPNNMGSWEFLIIFLTSFKLSEHPASASAHAVRASSDFPLSVIPTIQKKRQRESSSILRSNYSEKDRLKYNRLYQQINADTVCCFVILRRCQTSLFRYQTRIRHRLQHC